MEMLLQPLASLLEVSLRPARHIPTTTFTFGLDVSVAATTKRLGPGSRKGEQDERVVWSKGVVELVRLE